MMKKGITVHTIVKNEEKWIWFALMSVLNYVDKILVFDTGSDDKTAEIIKAIKNEKVVFEEKGEVDADGLVILRREQLARTKTEWVLILDGDEIWPEKTIQEFVETANKASKDKWGIVVRAWNLIGDIYHYHPESDYYHWSFAPENYLGWANLRGVRRTIPGLYITGRYPLEAYCDESGTPIQNYGQKRLLFARNRYFHTSYLLRSGSRKRDKTILNRALKNKFELGNKFSKGFSFPEVFYRPYPSLVDSPWKRRSFLRFLASFSITPLKKVKRLIWRSL